MGYAEQKQCGNAARNCITACGKAITLTRVMFHIDDVAVAACFILNVIVTLRSYITNKLNMALTH